MVRVCKVLVVAGLAALLGCAPNGNDDDDSASATDGGVPDGGAGDGGRTDASTPDGGFTWPVPTAPIPITPHASWKNRITPQDAFIVPAQSGNARWVKFCVLMRDPSKVYFQDSVAYAFHYEFAAAHLDPFVGMARGTFDQQSLHETGQEVILGAVLFPASASVAELGIQLVRQEPYHPEMVRILFDLVRNAIDTTVPTQAFYMPTFEQRRSAQDNAAFLQGHGITLGTPDRWQDGNACYAAGWALGRMTQVAADQLQTAYADGTLQPTDILVMDQVPAEVPYVAGVLSLTPSTPNSHVAILAQSWDVPFAYVRDPAQQSRWLQSLGREVALRVDAGGGGCALSLVDVDGKLSAAQRAEILALKQTPVINLPPLTPLGALSANLDGLRPADADHFGGKAANYGLLRLAIPEHVRPGMAFSFDLWTAFMDQPLASTGQTLRASIAAKLGRHTYPPDLAAVQADLETIRAWIKTEAAVPAAVQPQVIAALAPLPTDEKLRFRSSTNVEDSDSFTGAGLYESFSGCAADDTDADTAGPSHCDATEPSERGVFRALQRVYASFYNDNAFLERLRHHVDESRAAMGVLVHRTFVDADELANGVATVLDNGTSKQVHLVTQRGALSVTNPEGGAIPEQVDVSVFDFGTYPTLVQPSSLVVLGDTVLEWDQEYVDLANLLAAVSNQWASVTGRARPYALDLEYKKDRVEGLVVRQVRPLPLPPTTQDVVPFLLPQEQSLCVHQGEASDVFANHRAKSLWRLTTGGNFLREPELASSLFSNVEVDFTRDGAVVSLSGVPATLPGATYAVQEGVTVDGLDWDAQRHVELSTQLSGLVSRAQSPLLTLGDAFVELTLNHGTPVVALDMDHAPTTRTQDSVLLQPCVHDVPVDHTAVPVVRHASGARGLEVEIKFFYPQAPSSTGAGYTAPLRHWDATTVTGLASTPITLRGYYAQTFRPGHHNFNEQFILEPRLEDGINAAVLAELEQANIRALYLDVDTLDAASTDIRVLGADGTLRPWQ